MFVVAWLASQRYGKRGCSRSTLDVDMAVEIMTCCDMPSFGVMYSYNCG
jgi:hypothetical protein